MNLKLSKSEKNVEYKSDKLIWGHFMKDYMRVFGLLLCLSPQ